MILTGWLLDVYADPARGLVVWLIGEDQNRHELTFDFPITFNAVGKPETLRALWAYLSTQPIAHKKSRSLEHDSTGKPLDTLAVTVLNPFYQNKLFREVEKRFPQLDYYNCDLPISLRFCAQTDVFPMGKCEVEVEGTKIRAIKPLDTRWELFPTLPTLKLMRIVPNTDPFHERPSVLWVEVNEQRHEIPLKTSRPLLARLQALIDQEDPDLIITQWGDTWLFPLLERAATKIGFEFNPNRDKLRRPRVIQENSFVTYGHVMYRGRQTHLFGRWHIDRTNGMNFGDYGIQGVLEQANMTSVPVQEMSRRSPGAGITAMFMITTLRRGFLVPYEKLHVEKPKTLMQLNKSDRGGLVYQPTLGLHKNVVQIDYSSMYPSIMAIWNVSPETMGVASNLVKNVPDLDMVIDQEKTGIVSETLAPLLKKRLAIKALMGQHDEESLEHKLLSARSTALKWLLVVCFGYQGYKRFREGRIEAHEAITAFSRWCLFETMKIVEDMGFQVLHMYVDSVWIKRPDEANPTDEEIQAVLDRIEKEIGLPITTEARYRWIAFLSARSKPGVPVPNRYFGQLEDGSFKVRGTSSRRHDTPEIVSNLEGEILECLGVSPNPAARIADVVELIKGRIDELRSYQVPIAQLVMSVNVSKPPNEYKVRSGAAVAGRQLEDEGRTISAGQTVKFVYVKGFPRVHAWDLQEKFDPRRLDLDRYCELIVRMASDLLEPFGVTEKRLNAWIIKRAWYGPSPVEWHLSKTVRAELPLLYIP